MAERYRKGSKQRVRIRPKITAEAKAYLKQLAGEFGLGHAIELLVREHRSHPPKKKRATFLHSPGK